MKKSDKEIFEIIEKYIQIIKEILERERLQGEMLMERYITNTEIVPHDFFSDTNEELSNEELSSCDTEQKVLFKDFGKPIILFNDLKSSTKLIEELECKGELCIYAIYMYYSSKMMGEILDILNGKMVECTGDGHYSVFLEDEIDNADIERKSIHFFDYLEAYLDNNDNFIDIQNYIMTFNFDEVKYISPWLFNNRENRRYRYLNYRDRFDFEEKLSSEIRILFFYIFAIFNTEVNLMLEDRVNNKFLTRIGCKQGLCKITRVDINGHIKQDKLIGAVVHHSAHQASGK